MNAGTVSRLLSLIPERAARTQSGCVFFPQASASPHPERVAHLGKFLSWLSPLEALSKDDQRTLGLLANGKPPQEASGDEEGEEHEISEPDNELDAEVDQDPDTEDSEDTEDAEDDAELEAEPLDDWEPEQAPASSVVQHAAS